MSSSDQTTYNGPALFSYGFRPFFLLALTFAVAVIPFWLFVYFGVIEISGPFQLFDWHAHEIIFGYTSAVIAGFLFTAIPNWTDRPPIKGLPLMVLAALWLVGRAAVLGVFPFGPIATMLFDCGFLAAIFFVTINEVIAAKNWRNLIIMVPITIYLLANITFHIEAMTQGHANYGLRLGLAIVIFLITLIGGRIIPSFTRNWLVKQGRTSLPKPFNAFDGASIIGGAIALIGWVGFPHSNFVSYLLLLAGGLHFARLSRSQGVQTFASPLLSALHVAYTFVPLGLCALGTGFTAAGFHLLGIGAIGCMTLAVIMRASAGHTGRELHMSPILLIGFLTLPVAATLRILANPSGQHYQSILICSAVFWVFGFGLVLIKLAPWLTKQNLAMGD